jgi:hypothetical protein
MYQSGTPSSTPTSNTLENLTGRASPMAIDLASLTPFVAKPIINGEAAYDGPELGADTNTPYRVRQTAYLSFLSGAAGHTMGACGIFDWSAGRANCQPHPWQSVVGRLSSNSMGVLRGNLETINWQLLHQEKGRITNQASENLKAIKAVNCVPVAGDYPMLVGDSVGGLTIGWQVSDGSGIYVLSLDSTGGASDGYVAQGTGGQPFLENLESAAVLWSSYRPDGTLTSPTGGDRTDVAFQASMCR